MKENISRSSIFRSKMKMEAKKKNDNFDVEKVASAKINDNIGSTFNDLVKSGAMQKVMDREQEYKESGGYSELNSTIEKDSER